MLSVRVYSIIIECAVHCTMSGGLWYHLPNRTVYGPVVEITASVKNPRFIRSQVFLNYELKDCS